MHPAHPQAVELAILGAGPTGLGAAWRLLDLARGGAAPDWQLYDAAPAPGGLAGSVTDERGFRWDLGGHVIYSHYEHFDDLLAELFAPEEWLLHPRESWVHVRGRFVPYPIQRNLQRLPERDLLACLEGLLEVHRRPPAAGGHAHLGAWIEDNFGRGLAELFFTPFNTKMWAHRPEELACEWTARKSGSGNTNVPLVDLARILRCVVLREDDPGLGAAQRFPYPRSGGTGEIWKRVSARLPPERVHFGRRVVALNAAARELVFEDGARVRYRWLLSSLPLKGLLQILEDQPELAREAGGLLHSSVHAVGVGLEGEKPPELSDRFWLYFPELGVPFYRATVLSNYSSDNVPDASRHWSLLCEVGESAARPVDARRVALDCAAALQRLGFLNRGARVVSLWQRRLPYGYPVPFLGRDALLARVQGRLRELSILSRGRFGGWRYEVSNQDHSFMQGVEAVDALTLGWSEPTYFEPDVVNQGRVPRRRLPSLRPGAQEGGRCAS